MDWRCPYLLIVLFNEQGELTTTVLQLQMNRVRATSHRILRALDHYTSSTLFGGKGGAGPSSRHTTLEGPTEYTSACKMDVKSTWIPTWHQMDHVSQSLGLFSKTTSWRQAYHKIRRPWHSKRSQPLVYSILSCVRTRMDGKSLKQHLVEGSVTCDFTLDLKVHDHTT